MITFLFIISIYFSESLRCQLSTSLVRQHVKVCYHRDGLYSIVSSGPSRTGKKLNAVADTSDDNTSKNLVSDATLMEKIQAANDNKVFMRCGNLLIT